MPNHEERVFIPARRQGQRLLWVNLVGMVFLWVYFAVGMRAIHIEVRKVHDIDAQLTEITIRNTDMIADLVGLIRDLDSELDLLRQERD